MKYNSDINVLGSLPDWNLIPVFLNQDINDIRSNVFPSASNTGSYITSMVRGQTNPLGTLRSVVVVVCGSSAGSRRLRLARSLCKIVPLRSFVLLICVAMFGAIAGCQCWSTIFEFNDRWDSHSVAPKRKPRPTQTKIKLGGVWNEFSVRECPTSLHSLVWW